VPHLIWCVSLFDLLPRLTGISFADKNHATHPKGKPTLHPSCPRPIWHPTCRRGPVRGCMLKFTPLTQTSYEQTNNKQINLPSYPTHEIDSKQAEHGKIQFTFLIHVNVPHNQTKDRRARYGFARRPITRYGFARRPITGRAQHHTVSPFTMASIRSAMRCCSWTSLIRMNALAIARPSGLARKSAT
jgi:hypothetical protein